MDFGKSIPEKLFYRIGDVAEIAGVKPYVLRYWESEFPMISPEKSSTGQRVYKRSDVEAVLLVKHLLYTERYSIEGARKRIKELRKLGELKTVIETAPETLRVEPTPRAMVSPLKEETRSKIQEIRQELETLVKTPLQDIFKS